MGTPPSERLQWYLSDSLCVWDWRSHHLSREDLVPARLKRSLPFPWSSKNISSVKRDMGPWVLTQSVKSRTPSPLRSPWSGWEDKGWQHRLNDSLAWSSRRKAFSPCGIHSPKIPLLYHHRVNQEGGSPINRSGQGELYRSSEIWTGPLNNVYFYCLSVHKMGDPCLKKKKSRISLTVQLRLHASNAGGIGLIPSRGTKIPQVAACSQKKSPTWHKCVTSKKQMSCDT